MALDSPPPLAAFSFAKVSEYSALWYLEIKKEKSFSEVSTYPGELFGPQSCLFHTSVFSMVCFMQVELGFSQHGVMRSRWHFSNLLVLHRCTLYANSHINDIINDKENHLIVTFHTLQITIHLFCF